MPRYVTEAEVPDLLTPAAAADAVEESFRRLARGEVDNPPRLRLPIPGGEFAVMPCVDRGLGYAGLKTFAWTPGATPFVVVLLRLEPAELVAVVEADVLGQIRTAAASAVAARHLATTGARTLGVFGSGRQAASHVSALREALPIERVLVHGRNPARVAAFCELHDCDAGSEEEVATADVVVTATTSAEPVLRGAWLQPGALVIAIGANDPSERELDDEVLSRASLLCVDSRAQAREEAGDLILAGVDWNGVHELQDVVAGSHAGREHDDDIVVFKSSGLAAWDIAVAARVAGL
jgi:alanine dehydrogenase